MHIELHEYNEFLNWYLTDEVFYNLRIGQAFHNYFDLHKSTQYKDEFDKLYQLDGVEAIRYIAAMFTFN